MTSIPPTGASSRVFTEATPLRRAVTAFSARGRLPFSTQDSCSTPVFSLEGRIKPSAELISQRAMLISQRAIDEKQEELREGRDELCHLKKTVEHLKGEHAQLQSCYLSRLEIILSALSPIASSLQDIAAVSCRILKKDSPSIIEQKPITTSAVDIKTRIEFVLREITDICDRALSPEIRNHLSKQLKDAIGNKHRAENTAQAVAEELRVELKTSVSETRSELIKIAANQITKIQEEIIKKQAQYDKLEIELKTARSAFKAAVADRSRKLDLLNEQIFRYNAAVEALNAIIARKKQMKGRSIGPK